MGLFTQLIARQRRWVIMLKEPSMDNGKISKIENASAICPWRCQMPEIDS